MPRVVALPSVLLLVALLGPALSGCVAPVQWQRVPHEPMRHAFVAPHGVPLAFGGGVCPLTERHTHGYPPVPAAAFTDDGNGARDTRTLYAYVDPHRHHGRTCFRERWHLHLEPPNPLLRYDEQLDAFVAPEKGGTTLVESVPGHAPFRCQTRACDFHERHAHKPCEG